MIEISGPEGTAELGAARSIAEALEKHWPGISTTPAEVDHVKIIAGVKLSGYRVSDIDIVLVGRFSSARYIVAKSPALDADGNTVLGKKIRVHSVIAAIEVKDQPEGRIQFEAGGVAVQYKEGWKSATEQNENQRYALREYLKDAVGKPPWVYRCLVLRGIQELPRVRGKILASAGAVAGRFDAGALILAMAAVTHIQRRGGEHVVSSGDEALLDAILGCELANALVPSGLDRKRMDRVSSQPDKAKELAAIVGERRVHIRGNGGTGKTMLLLQTAHEAYTRHAKRVLLLTYNIALAADIQRSLALLNIPSGGDNGGISIRTTMSFLYAWLNRLEVASTQETSFEDYDAKCREAIEFLAAGTISQDDLGRIQDESPDDFDFDAILIDEAQDWPQAEADLVQRIYGVGKISIADGLAQLVRGTATRWNVPRGEKVEQVFLGAGLRMKANLCHFANSAAQEAGLRWEVEPNKFAAGGRVIVVHGEYAANSALQDALLKDAITAGNSPVDLLHCVPPSGVVSAGERRSSRLAQAFYAKGWEAWDGVDEATRRNFPRSALCMRILQYESCRGLEGWITVLDGIDEFWEQKRLEALREHRAPGQASIDDPEAYARGVAWRWAMIPLTRPVDTLVLSLRNPGGEFSKAIKTLASHLPDFVEFR